MSNLRGEQSTIEMITKNAFLRFNFLSVMWGLLLFNGLFVVLLLLAACKGSSIPEGTKNTQLHLVLEKPVYVVGPQDNSNCVLAADAEFLYMISQVDGIIEQISLPGVNDLDVDSRGNIWAATNNGLFLIEPEGHNIIEIQSPSLLDKRITNILIDENDVIWISVYGETLMIGKVATDSVIDFASVGNLSLPLISDITLGPDGTIWLATLGDGIVAVRGNSVLQEVNTMHSGISINYVNAVLVNQDIWVATFDGLINITQGESYIYKPDVPQSEIIYTLYSLDDRFLLVGGKTGFFIFSLLTQQWSEVNLEQDVVYDIYVQDQKVWVASFSGLYSYDLGELPLE